MDKQTFYRQLSEKLSSLGIGHDYIDRHLKQFDGFFEGKSEAEIEAEIAKLGDLDRVAARIKRMTDKMEEEESQEKTAAEDAPTGEINVAASAGVDGASVNSVKENKVSSPDKKTDVDDAKASLQNIFDEELSSEAYDDSDEEIIFSAEQSESVKAETESRLVKRTMSDAELAEKTKKFNIITACLSPLIVAVLLVIAAVIALLFFALGVVTVLSIAGLVGVTAAGTIVSVAGIIFSITIMTSSMPIGLYEFGISIMIGAAAMFVGVLLYNFAVRLMPYILKMLIVLVKLVVRKLKELFYKVKKEYIGV